MDSKSILFVYIFSVLPTLIMIWKPDEVKNKTAAAWITVSPVLTAIMYIAAYRSSLKKNQDNHIGPCKYRMQKYLIALEVYTLVYTIIINFLYIFCKTDQDSIIFDYFSSLLPPVLTLIFFWFPTFVRFAFPNNRLFPSEQETKSTSIEGQDEEESATLTSVADDANRNKIYNLGSGKDKSDN